MRMRQYVSFSIESEAVSAAQISARLGLRPDKVTVRGSMSPTPPVVPVEHSWEIRSVDQTVGIEEQAGEVIERLRPIDANLRQLMADGEVTAHLNLVRYFNDEGGIDEVTDQYVGSDGSAYGRFAGQHQMLGWCLSVEQIQYLASLPAAISADEYG